MADYLAVLRDERVHFVGLGLAAVGIYQTMKFMLGVFRDEAIVPVPEPKTQYITQSTEDELKIPTLKKLMSHYNFAIKDTTQKVIVSRCLHDPQVLDTLLRGMTAADYDVRLRHVRAVNLITDEEEPPHNFPVFHHAQPYQAIVRCLEHCLNDAKVDTLDDPYFDGYPMRDYCERTCLTIIGQLILKCGQRALVELIKAGFVERWLAKQPWGETNEVRRKNFEMYMRRHKNTLSDICYLLRAAKIGQKALTNAKLLAKAKKRRTAEQLKVVVEYNMQTDPDSLQLENAEAELMPRVVEQSVEEQRLRRRHREAMVLNDGTHSLGRGDIIEREHDSMN